MLFEWVVPFVDHDDNFNQHGIIDDQGRYTKMALKLEPNNPFYLLRNENAQLDYFS